MSKELRRRLIDYVASEPFQNRVRTVLLRMSIMGNMTDAPKKVIINGALESDAWYLPLLEAIGVAGYERDSVSGVFARYNLTEEGVSVSQKLEQKQSIWYRFIHLFH